MQRAEAYKRELDEFNSKPSIPYGAALKSRLEKGDPLGTAMLPALDTNHSSNIVDKAFRGLARFVNEDDTLEGYLSEDAEERSEDFAL